MFCSKCGTVVSDGAGFCGACGQPIASTGIAPAVYSGATTQPVVAYAGFWLRVVAAIIDGIILWIPLVPIFFLLFLSTDFKLLMHSRNPAELFAALGPRVAVFLIAAAVLSWLYWGLMECSPWQATLGKKALGLYVTDLEGNRGSFGKTSGRYFAGRFISVIPYIGGLYFFISCICVGFTEKKQALHDMISGCLVLKKY